MSGLGKQDDLLNKLGSKTKGEGKSPNPSTGDASVNTPIGSGSPTESFSRGDSLLDTSTTEVSTSIKTETNPIVTAKSEEETVKEPNSWTLDSALKEVKKLREENKISRVKYQEQVQAIKDELNTKLEKEKLGFAEAIEAKKELEALRLQEADRKRDLSEKLVHREALIAQLQAEKDRLAREAESKELKLKEQLGQLEAEKRAQMEVYQNKVAEELGKIPEKFREYAQKMVQGVGDPREALITLAEASSNGLFEEKKVIVNHSVPGANTGARANKEKLEAAAAEVSKNMSASQKIKAGLDAIRKGETNSAFRGK